ncbi:helix-hairpin-helix domain-containing protein [Fructilactobacillus fructivorans]|uniref:Late competence protein ComEA, DNA receptor n=1 Tax=Fructilactobacillus fructivorans TaxID=1614 RepID=A0A0C1PMY1_9LACO|nr:helix-hairpin-helix domain-containing protein [Fructilactobacillus fructivorans]KID41271.1 Late competence protein ComEA, DNA receptor [Fructilactobacillus fructivorans]MCT0152127.1 ComEA family DNA-binding protein [Fructilactobacillus fructivorans]MCT2867790.1 ComEA family DNA-binding protein [Fructilactobacillus fructivorans]MCT2868406.1 ComEA family DNA-binding protein [Fructilactobacillus fructivorans]MCT2873831.1 ComEA family DNA-binding protein [Fructilactobacillus fructivorans]
MDKLYEWIEEYKYRIIGGLVVMVIVLLGCCVFASQHGEGSQVNQANLSRHTNLRHTKSSSKVMTKDDNQASNQDHQQVYVDVKGAVNKPGVYQVGKSMRVSDAVELAGGFNRSADAKHINLAQKLSDQQVVYVPIRGEINGLPKTNQVTNNSDANAAGGKESDSGKININQADKSKLQQLNGIGEKKADKIIAYRKQSGPFKNPDDLKNVPGFGDKTVANLKSSITV